MTTSFDPETHIYRIDGRIVPSVTQVIGAVLPQWRASEWHMGRGRALHHGCKLLDEGILDWQSVAPEILGRVKAWEHFREANRATVTASESPLFALLHQFAGTPDRVFTVRGDLVLCDLKSTIAPQVEVQLGAYSFLWHHNGKPKLRKAVAVELRDDCTFKTKWFDSSTLRRAEQTFLATLTIFNWMDSHNLKHGEPNGRTYHDPAA